jgi:hypothetical protein
MASRERLPEALITCVLPEYEEKHIWWLVLQYLEDANFTHTASAFKLELSCKGIQNEVLGLSKVRDGRGSRCGTVGTPAKDSLASGRGADSVSVRHCRRRYVNTSHACLHGSLWACQRLHQCCRALQQQVSGEVMGGRRASQHACMLCAATSDH